MKIIHCADLHLDSKLTTHLSLEQAKQRRRELLIQFQKMVEYGKTNAVQVIIIAGDLFDTENISELAKNTVYQEIVGNPQIQFYYLQGNHDRNSFLSSLESIPTNLFMFNHNWQYYLANPDTERNIVIAGVELDKDNVTTIYSTLKLDEDQFNIVVLHGQEANAVVKHRAENINLKALQNKGIDYLALGHIHSYKYEKLDARANYCYPGCLEARGFDEVGQHGFVVLNINELTYEYSHHFINFATREFHEHCIDVSDCKNTAEIITKVKQRLDQLELPAKDMLKIVLIGEWGINIEKDISMVEQYFKSRFYLVKVYDQTILQIRYQDYATDQTLKGEFVRLLEKQSQISQADKTEIIRVGLLALAGEDIQ